MTSDETMSELLVECLLKVKRRLASFVGAAVQARHMRFGYCTKNPKSVNNLVNEPGATGVSNKRSAPSGSTILAPFEL